MAKSVTVNFEDGTSHVYDDVPDNVDDSAVQQRAAGEFNKSVKQIAQPGAPEVNQRGEAIPGTGAQPEPNMGEKAVGAAQTAYQLAEEHPFVATGLGYGAAKMASKIPGVAPAVNTLGETFIPKYTLAKNLMTGAENWAGEFANKNFANQSQALADLEHQVRQYAKSGQAIPEDLQRALEKVRGKVAGPPPIVEAPVPPATPTGTPGIGARVAGPVAPSTSIPAKIQQFAAQKVLGPLAEGAQAVMNSPIVNNPVTRFVASKPVQGALLAMHSADLGPPVPQKGIYRGMEINPNTGRPWTKQELDVINR